MLTNIMAMASVDNVSRLISSMQYGDVYTLWKNDSTAHTTHQSHYELNCPEKSNPLNTVQ